MSRTWMFRLWKAGIVVLAVLTFGLSLLTASSAQVSLALGFAVLVLVAAFLRIETGDAPVGFEAAVVFGALVVTHSTGVVTIAVFAGSAAYAGYLMARARAWNFEAAYNAGQLTISYALVAVLYTMAVAPDARPAAKMAGYVLLLIGHVAVQVLFVFIRRSFEEDGGSFDLRRLIVLQLKTLVLVTPAVAIEAMLHPVWGLTGFAVAFVPVLIVAYAMRSESDVAQQNTELTRRNREIAILTESSTQILSAESNPEALRRLMGLLSKLARLKACAVVTWEPNPDIPPSVYRFGECMPTDQEILRWVDRSGFAQSAPSRAFILQSDMRKFPLSIGPAIQVLIGIQSPEVIYGVLMFETEDLSILKAGSLNLLTLLVNQTALSIQDQLLRREMRDKTVQLETHAATVSTILALSNSLIGQFDIDQALQQIASAIRDALGFRSVVFALRDARSGEYVRRSHAGMDDVWDEVRRKPVPASEIEPFLIPEFRVSNSFFVPHTALRRSEHSFFVHPEEVEDVFLKPEEWHENDMLLVPLMTGEQMAGYLSVREPADNRIPTIEKIRTLELLSTQAVYALQSASQYEEIRRLTFIDALTPAYNHRYFQEALTREVGRHSRSGRPLALAMLDLDFFKKINDTFGHPAGDEILKGLVEELMRNARESDVVARYGGEEFAIIFPETGAPAALDAANRFRELVERRGFELPQFGRTLHITISIGVAVYPADGTTPADLISRADAALYWAKKHGRNRVAMASDVFEDEVSAN